MIVLASELHCSVSHFLIISVEREHNIKESRSRKAVGKVGVKKCIVGRVIHCLISAIYLVVIFSCVSENYIVVVARFSILDGC